MSKRRLTTSQITEIRRRFAQGERQHPLAREFGVTQSCISKIIHQKARTKDGRQCCDCGVSISTSRKRCDACRQQYRPVYFQSWYRNNKTNRRRANTTRRYRTKQGGFVVDKHTNEVYGPYTYNHARYLTAKWNKMESEVGA